MAKKLPSQKGKQSNRFLEAARELECDNDKAHFEMRLGKIAKAKPASVPKQKA